jgi:hypothetical protein
MRSKGSQTSAPRTHGLADHDERFGVLHAPYIADDQRSLHSALQVYDN